jgi:hypothetical protein
MVILDLLTLKPLWTQDVLRRREAPPLCFKPLLSVEENVKTFNKGSLGSRIDEERSKARNVV